MKESQPTSSSQSQQLPHVLSRLRLNQLRRDYKNKKNFFGNNTNILIWLGKNKQTAMTIAKDLFAVSSPVFRELVDQDGDSVTFAVEPRVFKVVKHFLHFNEFGQDIDLNMAFELLDFSLQYDIHGIINMAVKHVLKNLTSEQAFRAVEIARIWDIKEMETLGFKLICSDAGKLIETKEFMELGSHDVNRILSLDDLACKEEQVYEAAFRWAMYGPRGKNQKYYFSQVEKSIRFPLMTPLQLTTITLNNKLLDSTDIVSIFHYLSLPESDRGMVSLNYNTMHRISSTLSPISSSSSMATGVSTNKSSRMKMPRKIISSIASTGSRKHKKPRI